MRPRERREAGEQDLFRSRLDQIIDTKHALVKLARTIDWRFLEEKFRAVYKDGPGQLPLPTRLMAGLAILSTPIANKGEKQSLPPVRTASPASTMTRWSRRSRPDPPSLLTLLYGPAVRCRPNVTTRSASGPSGLLHQSIRR